MHENRNDLTSFGAYDLEIMESYLVLLTPQHLATLEMWKLRPIKAGWFEQRPIEGEGALLFSTS